MRIKRLHEKAIKPQYATNGAGAFDIYCYEDVEWIYTNSNTWEAVINTGWAFEVPQDFALLLFSRSGHGFNYGITLANSVGVIDSDYRGEVKVKLVGKNYFTGEIKDGTAIAQAILIPAPQIGLIEVDELTETIRGKNGFGSTDRGEFNETL